MPRITKKVKRIHQALFDFTIWYENGMKNIIHNCILLKRRMPHNLRNDVLVFLLPRAINGSVETLVLEVLEAYEMTDGECRRLGIRGLGMSNRNYKHLKKIRNKLIGHKIENSVKTDRYKRWYRRIYGSYESIFGLVDRVALRINSKVDELFRRNLLIVDSGSSRATARLENQHIDSMIAALESSSI